MSNVKVGDLAILVHPVFPENQDKICVIKQRVPVPVPFRTPENVNDIWWFCEYSTGVKVETINECGEIQIYLNCPYSGTPDWRLRKISPPPDQLDINVEEREKNETCI